MLVKESISFTRGQEPKDVLGIGDPKERKIQSSLSYIEPIVRKLELPNDEFSFKEFRHKVDDLKDIVEYLIIKHVREKYSVEARFETKAYGTIFWTGGELFAIADVGDYLYEFRHNGVKNAYWVKVISKTGKMIGKSLNSGPVGYGIPPVSSSRPNNTDFVETSQSSSLRIFDQKFQQLYKKFH